jgi:hypothetical protein
MDLHIPRSLRPSRDNGVHRIRIGKDAGRPASATGFQHFSTLNLPPTYYLKQLSPSTALSHFGHTKHIAHLPIYPPIYRTDESTATCAAIQPTPPLLIVLLSGSKKEPTGRRLGLSVNPSGGTGCCFFLYARTSMCRIFVFLLSQRPPCLTRHGQEACILCRRIATESPPCRAIPYTYISPFTRKLMT